MRDGLPLPALGWKFFSSLREEGDEPIYTYKDKLMRWFVRQSIKGGKVCAYNQYYSSKSRDNILKCLAKELNFDFESSSSDNIIETYLKYTDQQKKVFKKEYKDQLQDYRDIRIDEKKII